MTTTGRELLLHAWAHHPDCPTYAEAGVADPDRCTCALDVSILAIEAEAAAAAIERVRAACDIIKHLIDRFVPEYAPTDSGGDVDAALTAHAFLAAHKAQPEVGE